MSHVMDWEKSVTGSSVCVFIQRQPSHPCCHHCYDIHLLKLPAQLFNWHSKFMSHSVQMPMLHIFSKVNKKPMKRQVWALLLTCVSETNGHLQQHGKGHSWPKIIITGFMIATVIWCLRSARNNGLIDAAVSLVPVLIILTLDNLLKYLSLHRGKMCH